MSNLIIIAEEMEALLPLFVDSAMSGLLLPTEHAARFKGMAIDAIELISGILGERSAHLVGLTQVLQQSEGEFGGGPSYASVQEASQIARRADGAVRRQLANAAPELQSDDPAAELENLASSLEKWAAFSKTMGGLVDEDREMQVAISAIVVEGRALIEERLGRNSAFALGLDHVLLGRGGYPRNQNAVDLNRYVLSMQGAVRQIRRKAAATNLVPQAPGETYVSPKLITELRDIKGGAFDMTRLAEFCRELNVTAAGKANLATTMLVRAILDHVPPALGCASFAEVVSNYSGSKSFKDHMRHLDSSSRKIADGSLHTRIRRRESVPTDIEVDFRSAIGELVREVLRVARDAPRGV